MSKSSFPDCVQGFVPHRSIVTNARIHLGQKVLLHADIHNFFDSITVRQVFETFENLGCAPVVAYFLAKLCTLDGFLPQGSSASPVLANLVSRFLDADLCSLAVAHNCKYSRYGDDITISGDSIPQAAQIERILKKHGFELRDGKCRTQRRGGSQYVTGLSVFEKSGPRIPTLFKRRLRLELHYASLFGWKSHVAFIGAEDSERYEAARIEGWIRFIHSVEPQAAAEFDAEWQKILAKREEDDEQSC